MSSFVFVPTPTSLLARVVASRRAAREAEHEIFGTTRPMAHAKEVSSSFTRHRANVMLKIWEINRSLLASRTSQSHLSSKLKVPRQRSKLGRSFTVLGVFLLLPHLDNVIDVEGKSIEPDDWYHDAGGAAVSGAARASDLVLHHNTWTQPPDTVLQKSLNFLEKRRGAVDHVLLLRLPLAQVLGWPDEAAGEAGMWVSLYTALAYLVLVSVLTMFYLASNQHAEDMDFLPRDGLSDEIYDCCDHPNVCLASFCCPFARWADTMGQVGLLHFSVGLSMWIAATMIDLFYFFPLGLIILSVVGGIHRLRLRMAHKLGGGGWSGFRLTRQLILDIFTWFCCMPCAIAQEARHVERSKSISDAVQAGPRAYFNTVIRNDIAPKQQ
ncbi:unnamed protein product [Amoebophrya sp. A25]|nr:unnamed protein product [Amoebophrya sp. A25]|eukprot:GSA25T00000445001.1